MFFFAENILLILFGSNKNKPIIYLFRYVPEFRPASPSARLASPQLEAHISAPGAPLKERKVPPSILLLFHGENNLDPETIKKSNGSGSGGQKINGSDLIRIPGEMLTSKCDIQGSHSGSD